MAPLFINELKHLPDALRTKGKALQELEDAMRAKGDVTRGEVTLLAASRVMASSMATAFFATGGLASWFALRGSKWTGPPVQPRLLRFGLSVGSALLSGKMMYYYTSYLCTKIIFEMREERMKMMLANIILTNHSDDKALVQAVKKHFFAEHMFSDQHQDRAIFRWHPRHSYIDSAFIERMKEVEAYNSDGDATTISAHTTTSFGRFMEDPLVCILGSAEHDMEVSNNPKHTETTLKRREPRAHRRSRRYHHRHGDKFAAP